MCVVTGTCFFRSVNIGDDFTNAMAKGILDSCVFIACIGPEFWNRPNCMNELKFAYRERKKLVFVILPNHGNRKIHESISILMGNSLHWDLRNQGERTMKKQANFASCIAKYADEARRKLCD